MIGIKKNYFSHINQRVNAADYNSYTVPTHSHIINFDDVLNSKQNNLVTNELKTYGYSYAKFTQNKDRIQLEKWLHKLFGEAPVGTLIKSEINAKYYINSNLAQPIHTDEGYTTQYPRFVALYCQHNTVLGGANIVVNVASLYKELVNTYSKDVDLLFYPDAITIEGANGIKTKPILLRLDNDAIGISYSSVLKNMWCNEKVFMMFDFINHYIHDIKNQIRFHLKNNEMLIFDNCRILHGRTAFDHDQNRVFYRYWFNQCTL